MPVMRRKLFEIDYSKPQKVLKEPVRFDQVRVGQRFYIRDPDVYICITFVKVDKFCGEIYTWDEYAPKQSFPQDMLVYITEPILKPPAV